MPRPFKRAPQRKFFSRRPKNVKPAAQTSWDPLAEWYDGWMGQDGSYHHREIAVPAVLEMLELQPQDAVLDLGCGQGVLSEKIQAAGAVYTGVDASPSLIEIAKQRHGNSGRFLLGDVTRLASIFELHPASFDAAVFLLSLQDMENLDAALRNALEMLAPNGKLVLLLTHPAFRIQRQSGWGTDPERKLQYRRVDSYLSEMAIPLKSYPGKKGVSKTYHRPLQSYFAVLQKYGAVVEALKELSAEALLTPQTPRAERRAVQEIPLYLALRARKR
jgi:SAM-dependent methyltransferase